MCFKGSFSTFLQDDSGAVTTDWVAITAGVLIIGAFIANSVMDGTGLVGAAMATELSEIADKVEFAD